MKEFAGLISQLSISARLWRALHSRFRVFQWECPALFAAKHSRHKQTYCSSWHFSRPYKALQKNFSALMDILNGTKEKAY